MAAGEKTFEIDLEKLTAEVDEMSNEAFEAELLKARTQRKKQQLKSSGSDASKKAAAKSRERYKLLKQRAVKLGIWDKISAQATAKAEAEIGAVATENDVDDE